MFWETSVSSLRKWTNKVRIDMDTIDLTTLIEAFDAGAQPKTQLITLLVQHPTSRQAILARPQLAAALALQAQRQSGLSCEEVTDRLAAYISMEQQAGRDRRHYQSLIEHLQSCAWCYEEYVTAREIIADQQNGRLPRWSQQLPAPLLQPRHTPIILPRHKIHSIITDWRQPVTPRSESRDVRRGSATPGGKRLVFADSVPGRDDLFANITLARPEQLDQDEWQLLIEFEHFEPGAPLEVVLYYGTEQRRKRIEQDGLCHFTQLPAAWFTTEAAPDLLIHIEKVEA